MRCSKENVAIHSILARRYPDYLMRYLEILSRNDIRAVLVDASDLDFWDVLQSSTHYIHHYKHRYSEMQVANSILPVIDRLYRIPRYPNADTGWHYDDKIREHNLLKTMGFPFAESWVFYDADSALNWLNTAQFPLVYKLKAGAGSGNVLLVESQRKAELLVNRMFSACGVDSNRLPDTHSLTYLRNLFGIYRLRQQVALKRGTIHYQDVDPYWQKHRDYILFQEFLPNNRFDTRITVIGDRAFAFRRHNRPNDFRASGSGSIDYDQSAIDPRCIDIALSISSQAGFQSMAYDFMFDRTGEPKIGEISFTYLDSAVYRCHGYYQGASSNWIEGNHWPQYWILSDLLGRTDLYEPDLGDTKGIVRALVRD